MTIKVCLAGATGWAGAALARSIAKTTDVTLVAAMARKSSGRLLGEVLGEPRLAARIYASAAEALANPCDVFVEYTKPPARPEARGFRAPRFTPFVCPVT